MSCTMHGRFDGTVEVDGNLVVNGKTIRITAEKNPADLAERNGQSTSSNLRVSSSL